MKKKLTGILAGIIATSALMIPVANAVPVQAAQSGWIYNTSQQAWNYYGQDGNKYTGWHYMTAKEGEKSDHWNYFDKDGRLYTGWHWMTSKEGEKEEHWSYFGGNGWLRTNWQYLTAADGEKNAHWSYFGPNGWLRTGWQKMGNVKNPDGNASEHWSYFGPNGWLRTYWQQLGKGTNNPDGNAEMHWSYFGPNGWLRTYWQQLGQGTSNPDGNAVKHYSYFGANGWLRTQLQEMGTANNPDGNAAKHLSYFGDNGWLVIDKNFTYAGQNYKADDKGWATVIKTVTPAGSESNATANKTNKYKVTFKNGNTVLKAQTVEEGKNATPPTRTPTKEGYTFKGWDTSYNNITKDTIIQAVWEKIEENTTPTQTQHQHNWQAVYKTVHHDAVTHEETYEEPYTYEVTVNGYEIHDGCNGYRTIYQAKTKEEVLSKYYDDAWIDNIMKQYNIKFGCIGWGSAVIGKETKTAYETKTRTVVDKAAYDEQVVDYYKCSCGATKK